MLIEEKKYKINKGMLVKKLINVLENTKEVL